MKIVDNNTEHDSNKSFLEYCELTVDGTKKEGTQLKGKDVIYFNSPEIYFPENAPLDTENRELYSILNELFQGGSEGGDWQPPEWWIPVPEPKEYEIYILVWVTNANNKFDLRLQNKETEGSGFAGVFADWGDGTDTSYPAEFYWGSVEHKFQEPGQYLIKIVTSESLNVVYAHGSIQNCYWQIVKTGSNILFVTDIKDENKSYGTPLSNHNRLKYIKINNAKGLPFDKTNYYFERDYALQKIELKKAMSGNIPDRCFNGNAFMDLQQILDGNSVTSVGEFAFADCHSLRKIIFPNCTSVGNYAFQNCYNLQEVVVADNCTFGTDCFQNCYSLFPRPDGSVN